ncbi:MAG: PIN domain-containing protein [Cyanobacteria bacterium J06639_1]
MTVILDTSFLYALADRKDRTHSQALDTVAALSDRPLILPDVVLPEAFYLVASRIGHAAAVKFIARVSQSTMQLEPLKPTDLDRVCEIERQYADCKLDFVDAAIMAIAERKNITTVLTLDRRDFSIVRPRHCESFEILPT